MDGYNYMQFLSFLTIMRLPEADATLCYRTNLFYSGLTICTLTDGQLYSERWLQWNWASLLLTYCTFWWTTSKASGIHCRCV